MGLIRKLFGGGKSKNDFILGLYRQRLASNDATSASAYGPKPSGSMSAGELFSLPEAGIVTNVETYLLLKRHGAGDQEIFDRIEQHRSVLAYGTMPSNCDLRTYIKYRVKLENLGGTPISETFVDTAITETVSFFSDR